MSEETVWRVVTLLLIPASIWFANWYTKSYLPTRQKRENEEFGHLIKQSTTRDEQTGRSETSALETIIALLETTTGHLIANDNGHFTTLTTSINGGFKDLTVQIEKGFATQVIQQERVIASVNALLGLLARAGADLPPITIPQDQTDISQIMATSIKSDAVQESEKIMTDAIKPTEKIIADKIMVSAVKGE